MKRHPSTLLALALVATACQEATDPIAAGREVTASTVTMPGASQVASMYVVDFVSTAATGSDLNDAGDVVGRSYTDPGCGSFCLATQENVVWRGGTRIVLPLVPGYASSSQYPSSINNQGLIAGVVGLPGSSTRVATWSPNGLSYTAQDRGTFPGTSSADIAGLDDQGRVVGWATQGGAIPTLTVPFLWSQGTGMVDLKTLGYPNERPAAMSPGGKVVTWNYWYQLGNPASVVPSPAPPPGYTGRGSNGSAINDNGDQAHLLITIGSQNLRYPFRLTSGGTWQQLSAAGTGNLSRAGIGSINAAQDVAFFVQSAAMIAAGPTGVGQPLASLLSPAYGGASIADVGAMNNTGQMLASVYLGRSARLVKLTPAVACGADCIVSSTLVMTGQFVQDPAAPGSCYQGGKMYNYSTATATITNEAGAPLANAQVNGRFMDDYWTNRPVSGTTNAAGVVTFTHTGLCGVGAIAFLVEGATHGTRTFDRTRGKVADFVIPSIAPPGNQAPVARFTRSCNSTTRTCTFNGTSSTDDVGIVSYAWNFGDGTTGTGATASHTYASGGTYKVTLTVTDGGGLTNALTRSLTLTGGTNKPPVAAWTVSCLAAPAHTCTVNGTGSSDPDGSIVSYSWTNGQGQVVSTQPIFTKSWAQARTLTWTLTVTDNGGLQGQLTKTFNVP
jgi:probable HAF family extracellular repeat protein